MLKKLIIIALTFSCLMSNTYIAAKNNNDKYAEWCKNLDLSPAQARKLLAYLDECKKLVTRERLVAYKKAAQENISLEEKFFADEEAQLFWQKTAELAQDETLLAILVECACLASLDTMYLSLQRKRIHADSAFSQTLKDELAEAALYFEEFEKSIEQCKACHKLHNIK